MRNYLRWLVSDEHSWPMYLSWGGIVALGLMVEVWIIF